MEVIIVDNCDVLINVVNAVFHQLDVSHLEWNGKTWYSHSTIWQRRANNEELREWDPDHKCLGYWKHTFGRGDCDVDGNDNYDYEGDDSDVELPYETQRVEKIDDFVHIFNKHKDCPYDLESTIHLTRDMIVLNEAGLNSDHRGSNHLNIEIDHLFVGDIFIKAGEYKFKDLADLVWRVKGNKFDNQYECVFHVHEGEDEGGVYIDGGVFHVDLCVDHGS